MTTTKLGDTLEVLNRLLSEGLIEAYAIAGAVAAFRHVAATLTEDLDLLVSLKTKGTSGLVTLQPLLDRLKALGYSDFRMEGLVIGDWPVQFLPVASDLDAEALEKAEDVQVPTSKEGISVHTRALRPEHVVAIALRLGRPKDFVRIHQYLEEQAVDIDALRGVLERNGLKERWKTFCKRTGARDPVFR